MNGKKLTSAPEIAAYLLAHFLGMASTYLINPIIYGTLAAAGYREGIAAVALGMSVLTMIVVLLVFLGMRKLFNE